MVRITLVSILIWSALGVGACRLSGETGNNEVEAKSVSPAQLRGIVQNGKGHLQILYYWATWCGSCRPSLKILGDFQKKYRSKGLRVVMVALDGASDETTLALVKYLYGESGPYFAQTWSRGSDTKEIMTIVDQDWVEVVPAAYLLSEEGKILKRLIGSRSMRELAEALEERFQL